MAAKKKRPAKKTRGTTKKPVRRQAARKAAARKAAPKKTKRAAPARRAVKAKAKAKITAKKTANREFGEGNYKASKRFRDEQETFVKNNKARIPALGKAAEAALAGPEGDELRAAEASAAAGPGNTGG